MLEYKTLQKIYNKKIKELKDAKINIANLNKELILRRFYDIGEYTTKVNPSMFVELKFELNKRKILYKEKSFVLRKTINSIFNMLSKLKENDISFELGHNYRLSTMSNIKDFTSYESMQTYSKILLLLQNKVITLCAVKLQKGCYMVSQKINDIYGNINSDYLLEESIIEHRQSLKKCSELLWNKPQREIVSDSFDPNTPILRCRRIPGRPIPSFSSLFDNKSPSTRGHLMVRTRKNSFFTSSSPIRMIKNVDMNQIRRPDSFLLY